MAKDSNSEDFFRPQIDNPYPEHFDHVTGFRYLSPLVLARMPEGLHDRKNRKTRYVVAQDYTVGFVVDGVEHELTVPRGMLTDLTSVPRLGRAAVGRVGPHLEACIIHDYLFVAWQLLDGREAMREDWRFANEVLFAGLLGAKVHWFERSAIWLAMQFPFISWGVFRERDDPLFYHLPAAVCGTCEEPVEERREVPPAA